MGPPATAELTVIGLGSSDPGAPGFLAAIRDQLAAQEQVQFTIHGMGATLEGAPADIFALAAQLHEIPLQLGMPQVCTILKLEQAANVRQWPSAQEVNGKIEALATQSGAVFVRQGKNVVRRAMALTLDREEPGGFAPQGGAGTTVHTNGATATVAAPAREHAPAAAMVTTVASDAPIAVKIEGLTKSYGEGDAQVQALKGVDLEIRRGEFVAVMGPSGSGKSTFMHILGALETPGEGTIEIGGVSYAGLGDKEQTELRRDRIGFVFQFFNLLKTLSAVENVMLPSLIAGEARAELYPRACELLELVGLTERRDHRPSQMSGGEQQRVSIARSLIRNPELLLADEPTGNLDSKNSAAVLDMLGRLQATSGQTILMVTHDPVAASRATRVVFLRDGLVAGEVPGGDRNRIVDYFSQLARTAE